jgi:tripartite-type tricarboxylate transporter receptor subunit TctC
LLNISAGIDALHVPYKGEAPAIQDLLGGQIDAAITSIGAVARQPGKIIPLAVSSAGRFSGYKDVPTFAEAGFPQVDMPGWGAVYAPAKTPKPVLDKLAAEMSRIVMLPDVATKMLDFGGLGSGPVHGLHGPAAAIDPPVGRLGPGQDLRPFSHHRRPRCSGR